MSPKMRLTVTRPSTSTTPTRAQAQQPPPLDRPGVVAGLVRLPHRVRPTPRHAAISSPAGTAEPVRTLSSVWRKRQGLRWVPNTSTAWRTPTGSVSGSLKLRMTMACCRPVGDLAEERRQPQHEPQPGAFQRRPPHGAGPPGRPAPAPAAPRTPPAPGPPDRPPGPGTETCVCMQNEVAHTATGGSMARSSHSTAHSCTARNHHSTGM